MQRAILLAVSLFVVAGCSPTTKADTQAAPTDTAADVAKLKSIEDQWYDFYHKGDADGLANLYAEDGQVLAAGAPAAVGRAAIRTYMANDIANMKAAGLADNAGDYNGAGASGDLGWVSGVYLISNAAGTVTDRGKYTTIFQRTNGEWKIIRDTWNSDAAPAPAAGPPPAAPKA